MKKAFVMLIERNYPLPLHISFKENMTETELFEFCAANKHLQIERNEKNQLIVKAPAGGETGSQHSELNFAIQLWNKQTSKGKVFDSSTGFTLPDGSMRSPDVAWVANEKWHSLTEDERRHFLPFAPDFLVEVASPSDHLQPAQEKCRNGYKTAPTWPG